jgi:SAM-dependent methyltransferase
MFWERLPLALVLRLFAVSQVDASSLSCNFSTLWKHPYRESLASKSRSGLEREKALAIGGKSHDGTRRRNRGALARSLAHRPMTIDSVSKTKSQAPTRSAFGVMHNALVLNRRVEVLTNWFSELLPPRARVLDVGCGDGLISAVLQAKRRDIDVHGIDVLPRSQTHIPVKMFDGTHFPCASASFEVVLFSDVLHHTVDPTVLLLEARRVSARHVVIKDHYREGWAANTRLRFMDWVGNARFGVPLPYNYWTQQEWHFALRQVGLQPERVLTRLGLYPRAADWIFGARLHFIALLRRS